MGNTPKPAAGGSGHEDGPSSPHPAVVAVPACLGAVGVVVAVGVVLRRRARGSYNAVPAIDPKENPEESPGDIPLSSAPRA